MSFEIPIKICEGASHRGAERVGAHGFRRVSRKEESRKQPFLSFPFFGHMFGDRGLSRSCNI